MKKITRKRFTQSKGNKSFFGTVARFGAAIPLCLLMLGGLGSFDKINAATGTTGGNAVGITNGVPSLGTLVLDSTDTGTVNIAVGNGGDASIAAQGGLGGSTDVTGTPGNAADIVFTNAIGGNGANGGNTAHSAFNGGNAGDYDWTRTTSLTVSSIINNVSVAGNGGDSGTTLVGALAGNGGNSSGLNIDFGTNKLTLNNLGTATSAIDLTAGTGGNGGNTAAVGAINNAGAGGNGGNISFTAGIVNVTSNTNPAPVSFIAGQGGDGGIALTGATVGGISAGTGGNGGNVTVNLNSINFVSSHGNANSFALIGGDAGTAQIGFIGNGTVVGQSGGSAGNGGSIEANILGNINVKASMLLAAGDSSDGADGGNAGTALGANGGAGGNGGLGGSAVLNSGSITVGNAFGVSAGDGGAGGNGGAANAAAVALATGGAGGAGGVGSATTIDNLGAMNVGGILSVASGTGGAGGLGGVSAANSVNSVGGAGGNGAVGGAVNIMSDSITANILTINTDGVDGIDATVAGVTGGVAGLGVNGVTGSTGDSGAVNITTTNNIVAQHDMLIQAVGGDGGDGSPIVLATETGIDGSAGGNAGAVTINANELRVGNLLILRNADGLDGNDTPAPAGVAGLGGDGGTGGTITLNALVSAAEIVGTSGKAYHFDGLLLDAGQQQTSFSKDNLSATVGAVPGTDATYNIDVLKVDASDARLMEGDYTTNGEWLNVVDGNKVYRTLTASHLSKLNIDNYAFVLPTEVKDGDIMLEVSNVNPTTSGAGYTADDLHIKSTSELTIETPARIRNMHRNLGSIQLINDDNGEIQGADHFNTARYNTGIYRFVTEQDASGNLVARLDGIPGFNAYSEAQAARLAFVADGLNHVITSGIYEMSRATEGDEMGIRFFASGYGSKNRYSTGHQSNADIEGAGFLAGAGWATDTVDGQRLLLGAFMEGGWGSYDTHSASHGAGFDADGNTSYLGGGIMGKYTFPFGLYFDMSARVGNAKMDFRSYDLGTNGYENSFDSTNATYYGGHIGGGYEWAIDEQQSLDFNTRLLWTHLNSDNATSNYGDRVDFNSADSVRWRTGARYNYAFDLGTGGTIKPFVGVAYEQEFNGDAPTHVDGRRTEREASLSGGTAIGELGASWQATDNFSLELAGQGNVLTRQGGSGQLSLKWEF